jgi:hypothetical protein
MSKDCATPALSDVELDEIGAKAQRMCRVDASAFDYLGVSEGVPKLIAEVRRLRAEVAAAETRGAEREREACALECTAVYKEHRKTKDYPMDMGGLALECAERIHARAERKGNE